MANRPKQINSDLEVLRAIAVIFVIIQHFGVAFSWNQVGDFQNIFKFVRPHVGVDLFFCISGFIISKSLIPQLDLAMSGGLKSTVSTLKAFFIRRAYRLLPSSIFWAVFLVIATKLFNNHGAFGNFESSFKQLIAVMTYTYNIFANYMSGPDMPTSMGYYWSLSLEEQFYFIYPAILLAIRSNRHRAIAAAVMIALLFPIARQVNFMFYFKIDAMLWGILIYLLTQQTWLHRSLEPTFLANRTTGMVALTSLVLVFACVPAALHRIPILIGLTAIIAAVLVFVASYDRQYFAKNKLYKGALMWIGARSYGLYLIHMPAIYLGQELYATYLDSKGIALDAYSPTLMTAICVGLLAVMTELSYQFIEKPWRGRGARLAEQDLVFTPTTAPTPNVAVAP